MQETKLSATTNASDSPNKTADVALAEDKSSAAPAPAPANAQAQVPAPASEAKDTISVAEELRESQQAAAAIRDKQYHPIILSDLSNQASTSFWRGYRRFWPFLRPYWGIALLGILLTIPVGALDAVIALFLKPFTDQVMVEQEKQFADYVPLVIIGFTLIQGVFIYLSSLVNGYVGGAVNLLMRSKLYEKLLSFDSRFYDANNSGSVILRFFNDSESASNGLIQNIRLFLTNFSSISLLGVLLYNSWQLTIVAVGVVCFLIIPMRIVRRRVKKIVNHTVSASTGMITLYNETTLGSKVIKSFNLKEYMYQRFYQQAYQQANYLFRMGVKLVRDTNWLSPVMHFVSSLGVAGVLYFGVTLIINGTLTSGEFVSFLAALIMLYTPLKSIGNNYIQVQSALLALDRIYDLLDYESYENGKHEGNTVIKEIKKDIEFQHVYFSYDGVHDVLKDVSFKINVARS